MALEGDASAELDAAQRWFAAIGARDLDTALSLAHPELRIRPLQIHGEGILDGHEGLKVLLGRMEALGMSFEQVPGAVERTARDEYAIEGRFEGREQRLVGIYRFKDGLIDPGPPLLLARLPRSPSSRFTPRSSDFAASA